MAIDKKILQKFGHVISGIVVLIKGYDKFDHHHVEVGVVLMLLGVLFIAFAVFHEKVTWIRRHEAWLLWLEGVVLAIVSYSYFTDGKFALPFCYAFASLMYIAVGIYVYKFKEAH